MQSIRPVTFEDAAATLRDAAADGHSVTIVGGGTKRSWGRTAPSAEIELETGGLDAVAEHNAHDLTAVVQAGLPLARAQEEFAAAGQMLALDPPLGRGDELRATVGGVLASGDSGPLSHRYGLPRDLILGMTVALSDGTLARSGGKVIKNVAGYDLGKLFAGSFGTLGLILAVSLRLHPLPERRVTALGVAEDPRQLQAAAIILARAPLELEALDLAWRSGRGGLLARLAGTEAPARAERAADLMEHAGLQQVEVTEDDDPLWERQRSGQRAAAGRAMLRIATRPSYLAEAIGVLDPIGATVVGRAGTGRLYAEVAPADVEALRSRMPGGTRTVVLDCPPELREALDPWGSAGGPAVELMQRIKVRFDPTATCNPGIFVGAI